jgi:hypothetical protein
MCNRNGRSNAIPAILPVRVNRRGLSAASRNHYSSGKAFYALSTCYSLRRQRPPGMRMVHRFAYPIWARVDHPRSDDLEEAEAALDGKPRSKLHWLRDGDAGAYYICKLAASGYQFSLELNFPIEGGDRDSKADRGALATDRLKCGDVLLLNTRPPLSPDRNQLLAPIQRSTSWVEERIMNFLAQVFTICSRDEIVLSRSLAAKLPPDAKRAKLRFKRRPDAWYTHIAAMQEDYKHVRMSRTAGFLIYGREIWENGPDLLCSFAMSGPLNLIWAYLAVTQLSDRIPPSPCERFLMADFGPRLPVKARPIIPHSPDTLSFADDWTLRVVLEASAPKLWQ